MKLDTTTSFSIDSAEKISPDPLLAFFLQNHFAIWEAVRFLAGYEISRVVDKCAALLERDGRVTPRTRMMVEQIFSVLSLEHTDDPELPLLGYFAVLDPSDPVVEEICLLCDGLSTALVEAAKNESQFPAAPCKTGAA